MKQDNEIAMQDMAYEISILLEAMLFYAGVKKENLDKVAQLYIENIDKVLEDSQSEGFEECVEVINYLKKDYPEFF